MQVLQEELHNREGQLNEEGVARYNDLDSFLELAKNASGWWKKANDKQKREMADLLVLNVVVHGNNVASVSLNEPFATWAKRSKTMDGDRQPNRYYLFSITVELGKKLKYADYGAYQKRCETVYVKEVDGLKEPRKLLSKVI